MKSTLLRRTGIALASAALCVAALAGTAFAANTGTSDFYIQADDSQISWTVPVTVNFKVNADGTFQTPSNGSFINNSQFPIHVSKIQATAKNGATLGTTTSIGTTADTVGITVQPGTSGTALQMSAYTTAAAPANPAQWNIAKGSSLATIYTGKISSYGSISPSSNVNVVTVTWTAAAGTVSSS